MENLVNGFNPPHPNWADMQKKRYLEMCERRKKLFSRKGQHGNGLYKLVKEKGKELGFEFTTAAIAFFFTGRTYSNDILHAFNAVADEKELEYA